MAYTQAPIEMDLFMEIPYGIETTKGNTHDYVLQLLANIYGQKQAGRVWNQFLVHKLESIVYVDDGIFLGQSDDQLTDIIKELTDTGLEIDDQGHPADYVGVNIKDLPDGSYVFSQKTLIDAIINDVGLTSNDYTKPVPAKCTLRLHGFLDSPPFDQDRNYRSVVGKLN
ncbi:hypothetical protein ACHAW6_005923 [Cyclotella cf. meneghiniana]